MGELKKAIESKVNEARHFNRKAPGFYAKICLFRPDLFRTSFPIHGDGIAATNHNLSAEVVVPVETDAEKMYRESNEEYERLNRLW